MQLTPNTTLQNGKYRIERVLGQGGMGITYLAEHTILRKIVTIKEFYLSDCCARENGSQMVMATSTRQDDIQRLKTRFYKEAQILASLNHPNVVDVNDIFEENGTCYYVMDYIDGKSLEGIAPIPEADALQIIRELCKAVAYIHKNSVNHLDIKPANIMRSNIDGRIILVDFGLSKSYDEKSGKGGSSVVVGMSDGYSPLEQTSGNIRGFSPESDIYAVAATLYELLVGECPPNAYGILMNGLPENYLTDNGVSPNVIAAIRKAMEPVSSKRTNNVVDFLKDLGLQPVEECSFQTVSQPINIDEPVCQEPPSSRETHRMQTTPFNPEAVFSHDKKTTPLVSAPISEPEAPKESETVNKPKSKMPWILAGVAAVALLVIFMKFSGREDIDSEQPIVQTFQVNGVSFDMVYVDGGTFQMGRNDDRVDSCKKTVSLTNYCIGKYEVTQKLWTAVMGSNPSDFKGDDLPVHNVGRDIGKFLRKLNSITGMTFRLPNEAEWEYAAKGGKRTHGYKYSGSNNIDSVAWYKGNSGDKPHSVGTKQANELGIYDMTGNVCEWCESSKSVCRGGDCKKKSDDHSCYVYNRTSWELVYGIDLYVIGFRLAL